jgi:drug/metabolite transporter (DMT)-like permease
MISYGIIAALASVFLWTVSQLISKTVAPRIGNVRTALLVIAAGIIPMLALFILSPAAISNLAIVYSALSGVFLGLGFILFYKSVETQQISNAAATALVQPALLVLYAIIILSQPIDVIEIIGTVGVFAGVILISITKNLKFNKMLIPAILGNASWAVYWVFMSAAIATSGQTVTPLLISRALAIAIGVIAFLLFFGKKANRITTKKSLYIPIAVVLALGVTEGIMDGSGNLAFSIAVKLNLLGLGAVLTALEPVLIIVFAYFIYKDRLSRVQLLGIALATIGAVAIALF